MICFRYFALLILRKNYLFIIGCKSTFGYSLVLESLDFFAIRPNEGSFFL